MSDSDPSMRIYYVIYSADTMAYARSMIDDSLDPNLIEGAGEWTQTEGHDQYDYDYLADESDDSDYRDGGHGKWVAELTHAEFLALANARCWELDDDERPTNIEPTMGSITEHGHLDAYAVLDYEGWGGPPYGTHPVIDAQFYVSEGLIPEGETCELESAHA